MSNSPLLIVFVAKPSDMSYGDGMNTLRMWLDARKIYPSAFKLHTNGRVGFQISFLTERDARAFELFDWPPG